jgi:hypothetical protein
VNGKQRIVLWGAAVLMLLVLLFPPQANKTVYGATIFKGFSFLFAPRCKEGDAGGGWFGCSPYADVHWVLLIVLLFGISVLATALCLAFWERRGDRSALRPGRDERLSGTADADAGYGAPEPFSRRDG